MRSYTILIRRRRIETMVVTISSNPALDEAEDFESATAVALFHAADHAPPDEWDLEPVDKRWCKAAVGAVLGHDDIRDADILPDETVEEAAERMIRSGRTASSRY